MAKPFNLIDKRYGRLVAKKISHRTSNGIYWLLECDCGKTTQSLVNHLTNGHKKSCGCLSKETAKKIHTKHGMYNTPEYRTWVRIKTRCYKSTFKSFHNYGGRGIKVCKRWHKFENFYSDMGIKPFPNASIERIDNNKSYFPENCKWATSIEQNNNTRRNKIIEINGVEKNLFQWLKEYKIKPRTYYARIKYGWSVEDSIVKPVKKHKEYKNSTQYHPSEML